MSSQRYLILSKNNEKNKQDGPLSIFDGNKSLKRLIFVIENYASKLNEFYINRPGRLFYHFEYSRLEERVIDEYCDDKNVSSSVKQQIKSAYYKIRHFSFDMLKAIVDEHFRFPNDSINDIIEILNIDTDSYYKTVLVFEKLINKQDNSKQYDVLKQSHLEIDYNDEVYGYIYLKDKGKKINPNFDEALDNNEITEISYATNGIVFENQDKVVFATKEYFIEFNKKQKSNYDYRLV